MPTGVYLRKPRNEVRTKKYESELRWRKDNKERIRENNKKCRQNNPEKYKEGNRRSTLQTYGITQSDYDALLLAQDYACAICKTKDTGSSNKSKLGIDHDHKTGKVRGLLCHQCNVGIGHLRDDLELVKLAVKYLENTTVKGEI